MSNEIADRMFVKVSVPSGLYQDQSEHNIFQNSFVVRKIDGAIALLDLILISINNIS